jgi:hypothetical protein
MSEHTHICDTPTNPAGQVASPSLVAPPFGDIQRLAGNHRQMIQEGEVEKDTILGDHVPASSSPSDVDVSCRDSNCSTDYVTCALEPRSEQSLRGRHFLMNVAALDGHVS